MQRSLSIKLAPAWLQDNWRWLLVLSVLPLFSSKALYHVPLLIMAVSGLILILRDRHVLVHDQGARFILFVFLALWLPQLLALPGAVAPAASLRVTLTYVGYPLAALFILYALRDARHFERLIIGIACVIVVWGVDVIAGTTGLAPRATPDPLRIGDSLLGRLSLGHFAAVLSPLLFELVRRHRRQHPWAWLLVILAIAIVVLSGRRVAWLMLLIAVAAYILYLFYITRRVPVRMISIALLLLVVATALLYWQHEPTGQRLQATAGLFSSDIEILDRATSRRIDIWHTAWHMAQDNWQNGVGVRGFRHAYSDYAAADDYWLQAGVSVTHPHQFVLEIAAESGAPGLLGYLFAWWLLWRLLRSTAPVQQVWVWPCAVALGVALFPLNAHHAFYGAYWSALLWWLIGLLAAARYSRSQYQ